MINDYNMALLTIGMALIGAIGGMVWAWYWNYRKR